MSAAAQTFSALKFVCRRCCNPPTNQDMGCDDLPAGLCRPSMGRIASPRIRKECQKFPVVAESIVKANGLNLEEFNR